MIHGVSANRDVCQSYRSPHGTTHVVDTDIGVTRRLSGIGMAKQAADVAETSFCDIDV